MEREDFYSDIYDYLMNNDTGACFVFQGVLYTSVEHSLEDILQELREIIPIEDDLDIKQQVLQSYIINYTDYIQDKYC